MKNFLRSFVKSWCSKSRYSSDIELFAAQSSLIVESELPNVEMISSFDMMLANSASFSSSISLSISSVIN